MSTSTPPLPGPPRCQRQQELAWHDPWALVTALARACGPEGVVFLDGDASPLGNRAVLAVNPLEVIECRGLPGEPRAADPFGALAAMASSGGEWLGWLAYEAGAWVEPAPHWRSPPMAVLRAGRYDPLLHMDLGERRLWLEGSDPARLAALARLVESLRGEAPPPEDPPGDEGPTIPLDGWHWHTDRQSFAAQVDQIRSLIASGDLFQANLTACCEQRMAAPPDPLLLYGRLRRRCPAPFAGLAIGGQSGGQGAEAEAVLSASPERFLRLSADGLVESRPIKGTRPRHGDPEQDAAAAAALVSSPKDRAENVMIVDLLRNDLGRVCQPGSIHVPQLVGLERYRHVHHLTSVVQGRLRPGLGAVDLLRACWPGGSISGAPKLRACRRLDELEPLPRGPYCGALFRLGGDGSFDSSILIRSLMLQGSLLRAHAGCGIVADSDPTAEAEELGWKLKPLLEALV
jgi:para-aminobenzoate synthetase component 1